MGGDNNLGSWKFEKKIFCKSRLYTKNVRTLKILFIDTTTKRKAESNYNESLFGWQISKEQKYLNYEETVANGEKGKWKWIDEIENSTLIKQQAFSGEVHYGHRPRIVIDTHRKNWESWGTMNG